MEVLIVGAGPAGLTAAYLLTKKSTHSVTVIEANPGYVGGISRTESKNGYSFDIGGHRFFSKSDEVEALWREILPDDFIERPRSSRIFYKKKFYTYPLKAFEALANLGLIESTRCVASYAWARAFLKTSPKSFHDWVANQFGERLFRIFFKTYTEKVWGMSCDAISADWAAQRIKGLNMVTAVAASLKKSLGLRARGRKDGAVIKTLIESFRYPRKGPGMMWEAAAQKMVEQGGALEMGVTARVFAFDSVSQRWRVDAERANGEPISYEADHVIVSAAAREVVTAIKPVPVCIEDAKALRYRDFIMVALMLNTDAAFDDNWIYIHEPGVQVGRIQNYASWSPDMVPRPGTGCLGMEYFCNENDVLWSKTNSELTELAIAELELLGLAARQQVIDSHVIRQPKAYPVYDAGYKENIGRIRAEIEMRYPRLRTH